MDTPAPTDAPEAPDPHKPSRLALSVPDAVPEFGFVDPQRIPTRAESFASRLATAVPAVDAAPDWELRPLDEAAPIRGAAHPGVGRTLRTESMGDTLPAPSREWLETRSQVADAVHTTVSLARLNVACADADGAAFDLGSRSTVELIERLLLDHANSRVRILVDDPEWLERGAPRLRLLQRRFPHALRLRVADIEDAVGDDRALIADHVHFVLLRPHAQHLGERWTQHALRAAQLLEGFDRRWERAAHDLPVQPLGL